MKWLLFFVLVLFLGVWAALHAAANPGYVLIARAPWSMEMSLTLFIPLLLAAFVAFYALLYVLVSLWRIPRIVARRRTARRTASARRALIQGLTNLAEGTWVEAESQLLSGLHYSDAPLLNYLGAALAGQGQGNLEKRDEYLARAHKSAPQNHLAIGVTQAYTQFLAHQLEQALATLTELRVLVPQHRQISRLLAQIYQELHDWPNLINLIPDLRRGQVLAPKELDALELAAHRELLRLSLPSGSRDVLEKAWNAIPEALRRQPSLIGIYAQQLIQQGEPAQAESLLRDAIDRAWDPGLVELYGHAPGAGATEQLATAEGWLGAHADDPTLYLTLGQLAARAGDESRARRYLERCVVLQGPAEAYQEIGALLERHGETEAALTWYRRGLELHARERRAGTVRAPRARLAQRAAR